MIQAAAQRWIEILGEAAPKVSDSLRASHPEIAWREIVGTRVILAHAYFEIDPAIVERVIREEIPLLRVCPGQVMSEDRIAPSRTTHWRLP